MLQKFETPSLPLQRTKKSWMGSDLFEDWVREQDKNLRAKTAKSY